MSFLPSLDSLASGYARKEICRPFIFRYFLAAFNISSPKLYTNDGKISLGDKETEIVRETAVNFSF